MEEPLRDDTPSCRQDVNSLIAKYLPLIEHLIGHIKSLEFPNETQTRSLQIFETLHTMLRQTKDVISFPLNVYNKFASYLDSLGCGTADTAPERFLDTLQQNETLRHLGEANLMKFIAEYLLNTLLRGDSSPERKSVSSETDQEHILPDDMNDTEHERTYASMHSDEDEEFERLDPLAAVGTVLNGVAGDAGEVVLLDDSSDDADDDVCIIETRNSPICLDTDEEDDDEPEADGSGSDKHRHDSQAESVSSSAPSYLSVTPTVRTELCSSGGNFSYLENVPVKLTPRQHLVDSIEISDSDSDSGHASTSSKEREEKRKSDFLGSIELMSQQAFRKAAARDRTTKMLALRSHRELMKEIVARDWLRELCEKFATPHTFIRTDSLIILHQVLTTPNFECVMRRRHILNSRGWLHIDEKIKTYLSSVFFSKNLQHLTEDGWRMWQVKCSDAGSRMEADQPSSRFTGMNRITSSSSGGGVRGRRKKDDDEYTPPAQANGIDSNTVRRSLRQNRKRSVDTNFTYNEDVINPDYEEQANAAEKAAVQQKIDMKRQEALQRSKERAQSFERYFRENFHGKGA